MAEIIADTNIIFRLFSKKSKVRELFFKHNLKIYAPSYLIYEIVEKTPKIIKNFKISEDKFLRILVGLYEYVSFVPEFFYGDKIDAAYNIAKNFDEDDTPFIALEL